MADQIRFSLSCQGRVFIAQGLDVPVTAQARTLQELRPILADAVEKYLGRACEICLLIGARRGPQSATVRTDPRAVRRLS